MPFTGHMLCKFRKTSQPGQTVFTG